MIREISYSTKENPFAIKSAKKIDKKNNLVSMPLKSSMPVFKYSANNAEASYVPFLGKSEISFGNATKQQQVVVIDGPRPTAADAAFGVELSFISVVGLCFLCLIFFYYIAKKQLQNCIA